MFFTILKTRLRIYQKSSFYFSGNVIDGVDTITNDNLIGVTNLNNAVILDKPIDLGEYEVPQETAF